MTLARQQRNRLHTLAHQVRENGYELTEQDREDLWACLCWAEAMLNDDSLDVGEVSLKIYGRRVA